jgi:hypothetical protein
MNHSESLKELAAALAKAQGVMAAAKMDAVNPFLKNKYADLGSVIAAAKKPLADNGLSYSQHPHMTEREVGVTTILMHASGEWLESVISIPMSDDKGRSLAQNVGSIITYLRRYSLSAILGIHADEDTDGNEKKQQPAQATKIAQVDTVEGKPIMGIVSTWPKATIDAIVTRYKLTSPKHAEGMLDLSGMRHDTVIEVLVEWCDEYREFRMQVNEAGKQIYSPQQAAELVAEARAMKDEIAQA